MTLLESPVAKSLTPAFLAAGALAAEWVASGKFDAQEWRLVAAGAVTSFLVWLVPNVKPTA